MPRHPDAGRCIVVDQKRHAVLERVLGERADFRNVIGPRDADPLPHLFDCFHRRLDFRIFFRANRRVLAERTQCEIEIGGD